MTAWYKEHLNYLGGTASTSARHLSRMIGLDYICNLTARRPSDALYDEEAVPRDQRRDRQDRLRRRLQVRRASVRSMTSCFLRRTLWCEPNGRPRTTKQSVRHAKLCSTCDRSPAGGTGGTSRRGGEKAQEGVAESMGDRRKQRNPRLPHAASRALSIGDRENQEHRTLNVYDQGYGCRPGIIPSLMGISVGSLAAGTDPTDP